MYSTDLHNPHECGGAVCQRWLRWNRASDARCHEPAGYCTVRASHRLELGGSAQSPSPFASPPRQACRELPARPDRGEHLGFPSSPSQQAVGRRLDAGWTAVQDVSVDHRRGDTLVAEQFLNRADVAAVFEQVGGEGMPEGVTSRALRNAGGQDRSAYSLLGDPLVQVVSALLSRFAFNVGTRGWKDPLAGPLAPGGDQLPRKRVGKLDPARAIREAPLVLRPHAVDPYPRDSSSGIAVTKRYMGGLLAGIGASIRCSVSNGSLASRAAKPQVFPYPYAYEGAAPFATTRNGLMRRVTSGSRSAWMNR